MNQLYQSNRIPYGPLIIKEAKRLHTLVNKLGFFRSPYFLKLKITPSLPGLIELNTNKVEKGNGELPTAISVTYSLNSETYCRLNFEMEEQGENSGQYIFTSSIPSVYSDLGKGTGTFLFYLQILLAHRCRARYIVLDNDTAYPDRAAQGIYKWFRPNNRNFTEYNRIRFQEANTILNKLSISGGKMVMDLHQFSDEIWKEHVNMIKIGNNTNENTPWNHNNFKDGIDKLFTDNSLSSYGPRRSARISIRKSPYSRTGGKRKTRGRRKSYNNRR
jgi:hypothetical protein